MPYLKNPMNFRPNGRAETLEDGSRELYDQIIAFAVLTENGELPLEPSFGTTNTLFIRDKQAGLRVSMNSFWPEVTIQNISESDPNEDGEKLMKVDYEV